MTGKHWCTLYGGIWHVIRGDFEPPEGTTQIETACYRLAIMPRPVEHRVPECELCYEVTP